MEKNRLSSPVLRQESRWKEFNIWAFLFGWLYFLYKGCGPIFILYGVIGISILTFTLINSSFFIPGIALFVLWHLYLGFVANKQVSKTKNKAEPVVENVLLEEPTYFNVSCKRLVIMSILSLGIYDIYWMYKNWQAISNASNEKFFAFGRSWVFGILFIIPLLEQITKSMEKHGLKTKYLKLCGILYVIFWILGVLSGKLINKGIIREDNPTYVFLGLIILIGVVGSGFLLVPFQKGVNAINGGKEQVRKSFINLPEVLIILFMIAREFVLPVLQETYTPTKLENTEKIVQERTERNLRKIQLAAGVHDALLYSTVFYPEYCEEQGYHMTHYGETFRRYFSPEIQFMNKMGEALSSDFWSHRKEQILKNPKDFRQAVVKDMEEGRQIFILNMIAENLNVPVSQVEWSDSYFEYVSMPEYCEILDTNAEFIFSNSDLPVKLREMIGKI